MQLVELLVVLVTLRLLDDIVSRTSSGTEDRRINGVALAKQFHTLASTLNSRVVS